MENEARPSSDPKSSDLKDRGLPKAAAFSPDAKVGASGTPFPPSGSTAVTVAEQADRSGIFGQLVKGDTDIAGLVAYSIYKQNKLDWARAFEAAKGREPNEAELAAYIIGEGTTRRIATYRHLAEATLAGQGPNISGEASLGASSGRLLGAADTKTLTNGLLVTYGLIAILFLIVLWFATHLSR